MIGGEAVSPTSIIINDMYQMTNRTIKVTWTHSSYHRTYPLRCQSVCYEYHYTDCQQTKEHCLESEITYEQHKNQHIQG